MRVLIVTAEYGTESGGLSIGCYKFASMLRDIGHTVEITLSVSNHNETKPSEDNREDSHILSRVTYVSSGGYNPILKQHLSSRAHIKNCIMMLQNDKPVYVIAFGAGFNGVFSAEIAKGLQVPLIILLRGSEINLSMTDMQLRMANFSCLQYASKVISLSEEMLERAKEICPNHHTHYEVIPNPIAMANHLSLWENTGSTVVLGCGARHLNEKKGVANLIAMMSYLRSCKDHNFLLELCGAVDEDLMSEYSTLCSELEVADRVSFFGDLSRDDFTKRMNTWDFYVQASFSEGFSNSVGEYLSLGKSFFLSDSGFLAEILKTPFPMVVLLDHDPKNMAKHVESSLVRKDLQTVYKDAYGVIYKSTEYTSILNKWRSVLYPDKGSEGDVSKHLDNILCVVSHDIGGSEFTGIDTPTTSFRNFVELVTEFGYQLCSAEKYFQSHDRKSLIICTFDDAYSGVWENAFPVLKEYHYSATIFVCYEHIGKNNSWNPRDNKHRRHMTEEELILLKEEGWEIGSHGMTHNSLLKLSSGELGYELSMSREKLEAIFNSIKTYAYPYGYYNDYCKICVSNHYQHAFALGTGGSLEGIDDFQIRRYSISEITKVLQV